MRRVVRRLFMLCSALSLLLCVAVCVLWVRSYWCADRLDFDGPRGHVFLTAARGRVVVFHGREPASYSNPPIARPAVEHSRQSPPVGVLFHFAQAARYAHQARQSRGSAVRYASGNRLGVRWAAVIIAGGPSYRWAAAPLAYVCLTLALPPALRVTRAAARRSPSRRWAGQGRCRTCGYDLCASPGRCPECGATMARPPERASA
jgi:hypothetical protein